MALITKGVPKYILIGLLQEGAFKIATTYLDNTALLEELKTSDLPKNIHGLLEIAIRTHREPLNAVSECLTWIRQAETPNSLLQIYILHSTRKNKEALTSDSTIFAW